MVVGGVRRRVVVDGTEQLVDEADLTGRRVVSGDAVLAPAAVRLLAVGAGLLLVLAAFLGVLGAEPGVLLAGPQRVGVVQRGQPGALGGRCLLADPPFLRRDRRLLLREPQAAASAAAS